FRWTPLAADLGEHAFDFKVSDGSNETTVTININVKSAIGSQTAPIFRQPLGTGTTIDLSRANCVDLDVVVEDQDTPNVKIAQEEPTIEGADLKSVDGQSATWHWCPSRAQEGEDRYTLTLSADDGDNPKTLKNYLVVLRGTGADDRALAAERDDAPRPRADRDGERRQGHQGLAAVLLLDDEPGQLARPVDDDAGVDGADQRRRDERPVHRDGAE